MKIEFFDQLNNYLLRKVYSIFISKVLSLAHNRTQRVNIS